MNRQILLYVAVSVFLVCSCSTARRTAVIVTAHDSLRSETQYKYVERIDTVLVTLPRQTAECITPDTTSTLETDFALSTATVRADGSLRHTLETKPQSVPVPSKTTAERKDSIVYREVEVPVPYPVTEEVNRLTWWQQAQIYGCRVMVALFVLLAIVRCRKKILPFIRSLL